MNVIRVENIGKEYRVGALDALGGPGLLRDKLAGALRHPLGLVKRKPKETFWALKDISFEVKEGEVLGLIGRNGAGKSTLLKILSRITKPTTGHAEIHGRVGSLLEVGTGFHPELSGRENVFLNGAILGMRRQEITRKFDEIVAFAEVEKFIDTPVKHYSSGMYIRLAFAVAAHLETEILFVDEVLSVGDVSFQKKCLGKMGEVARQGRTVVFISHQLSQIRRLCDRVMWVDAGQIRQEGSTHEVTSAYEIAMMEGKAPGHNYEGTGEKSRFLSWELVQPEKESGHVLDTFGPLTVRFRIEVREPVCKGVHGVALYDKDRRLLWGNGKYDVDLAAGLHEFCHEFPILPLRPGPYTWLVSLWQDGVQLDAWDCIPEMTVALPLETHRLDEWAGILNVPTKFATESVVEGAYNS